MFRNALFEKHGIRNCSVRINRSLNPKIPMASSKKKLLPSPGNSCSNVFWLPTSSSAMSSALANTSRALGMLADYQEKNNIVRPIARQNVRRQRAKSMFVDRAIHDDQSDDINRMKYGKCDLSELQEKFKSRNFGLKPACDRLLAPAQQQPLSQWQKMMNEFKERIELKLAKK